MNQVVTRLIYMATKIIVDAIAQSRYKVIYMRNLSIRLTEQTLEKLSEQGSARGLKPTQLARLIVMDALASRGNPASQILFSKSPKSQESPTEGEE